ncbi:MAG: hypothetical protein H7235_00250 [Bdellovibrionaceae bacterium]|nr:hypothetical protein [Pseudobdellovibrionaceae bacterium]
MKSLLILVLALAINSNVMAQEPETPASTLPSGAAMPTNSGSGNSPGDKTLVDQKHKPESAFEGHDKASKKQMKKNKKKFKKSKKHGAFKHLKNKKRQA